MSAAVAVPRFFEYKDADGKKHVYEDPDPGTPVDEVLNIYSAVHPELVNAQVTGPVLDESGEKAVFTFELNIGKHG